MKTNFYIFIVSFFIFYAAMLLLDYALTIKEEWKQIERCDKVIDLKHSINEDTIVLVDNCKINFNETLMYCESLFDWIDLLSENNIKPEYNQCAQNKEYISQIDNETFEKIIDVNIADHYIARGLDQIIKDFKNE